MFKKLFGTNNRALQSELEVATRMFARAMRVHGILSDEAKAYEAKINSLEAALSN